MCPKRSGLLLSSDAFWKLSPCQLEKKFWAHFLDFCVQKPSCLLWSSDAFWKFSACKVYRKKFREQCHDICVQKRRYFPWSPDASGKFSPCKVYTKRSGNIFLILRPKTKLFAVKFRPNFNFSPCMLSCTRLRILLNTICRKPGFNSLRTPLNHGAEQASSTS